MEKGQLLTRIIKIIGFVLVALLIGILTYLGDYYHADQTAHDALISDDQVECQGRGKSDHFHANRRSG